MLRWIRRGRWWAGVLGSTVALGLAWGQGGMDAPPGLPKVGDTITLKFKDGQDRQFKVLKVEQQPNGTFLSEVKDTRSGEVITLLDKPFVPPPKASGAVKTVPPQAKARPVDPVQPAPAMPPYRNPSLGSEQPAATVKAPTDASSAQNKPSDPNKRGFLSRLGLAPDKPAALAPAAQPEAEQDPSKKPGFMSRLFGLKKSTQPGPGTPSQTAEPPAINTTPPAMPPTVRPTPSFLPPSPAPNTFPATSPPTGSTVEPPRVAPARTPVPTPPAVPAAPPVGSAPSGPVTSPAPMAPGLPSIPITPGGMSRIDMPLVQTRFDVPAGLDAEIQPYALTLRNAHPPSERIGAVQALAGCRHASSEAVKSLIFSACIADPCPLVRACCIDELCTLGYYNVAFLAYLNDAATDPSTEVRASARTALRKMTPQR